MPVGFLTEDQKRRYGRFNGEPTSDQLARYFHLDDADLELVARRRGNHMRLGFALQLGTVRFLGTFLDDPSDVPPGVVANIGTQLSIPPVSDALKRYFSSERRRDHTVEIREYYGYRLFTDFGMQFRLVRWLYSICWTGTERPSVWFDRTTYWLVTNKILLPGSSVLERLIARIRHRANERLWRLLGRAVTPEQQARLETLLTVPDGSRQTSLDRLRRAPTYQSGPELVRAIARLNEVRALRHGILEPARIPESRIVELARFASAARAQAISRMPEDRRVATLFAFVRVLEATATDDVLDLLDILITQVFADAVKVGKKARLRTLKDLDSAAIMLREACAVLIDHDHADSEVRKAIFARIPRENIKAAISQVDSLARPPEDLYFKELLTGYRRVRRFLPSVLQSINFDGNTATRPLLEAIHYMRTVEEIGHTRTTFEPPMEIVSPQWLRHVLSDDDTVNPQAYTFCLLDQLRYALRRRDIFVAPSMRYADPRAGLLDGAAWESARPSICRTLGRITSPDDEITALAKRLEESYRTTCANLPNNPSVY